MLCFAEPSVSPPHYQVTRSELRCLTDRLLPTRALENNLYVVYANRCGVDEGNTQEVFLGLSTIASPHGEVLAQMGSESGCSAVVTLTKHAIKTAKERHPFLHDLRSPYLSSLLLQLHGLCKDSDC